MDEKTAKVKEVTGLTIKEIAAAFGYASAAAFLNSSAKDRILLGILKVCYRNKSKMKIKITEIVEKEMVRVIDVELPYFYKHDLMLDHADSVIYGKIEENTHTAIQETENCGVQKFEIEKEEYSEIKNSGVAPYFGKQYQSNRDEFEAVVCRLLRMILNKRDVKRL